MRSLEIASTSSGAASAVRASSTSASVAMGRLYDPQRDARATWPEGQRYAEPAAGRDHVAPDFSPAVPA